MVQLSLKPKWIVLLKTATLFYLILKCPSPNQHPSDFFNLNLTMRIKLKPLFLEFMVLTSWITTRKAEIDVLIMILTSFYPPPKKKMTMSWQRDLNLPRYIGLHFKGDGYTCILAEGSQICQEIVILRGNGYILAEDLNLPRYEVILRGMDIHVSWRGISNLSRYSNFKRGWTHLGRGISNLPR